MRYESKIARSASSAKSIYNIVSNLQNLERVKDLVPKDKIQELEITPDEIRIKVDGLGQKLSIVIEDKEEYKVVKYGIANSPIPINLWIQMKEMGERDTRLKITLDAEIPAMFRIMIEKKLQQGIDQGIEMLAQFPFESWEKGEVL